MKPFLHPVKCQVSAVMITFNEAVNLKRTITQLSWCDEVIVVDSFSTDGTDRIAKDLHCRLVRRSFESYSDQKSFAISLAKHDWVLCLDADEYLTSELIREIKQELQQIENIQAFAFPSNLVFRKQRFRFGRESKRLVVKLFNRKACQMSDDRVHEKIIVYGRTKNLKSPLLHYSYRDITQYFNKFDRYTEWGAEKYFLKGKRKSIPVILVSIPYYFLRYYLKDRNIFNGMNGFYWSALMAFYHFVKYIKLEDLEQSDNSLSFSPLRNRKSQINLSGYHLLVTEYGNLIRHKKNGRL
jgi:glycosyltransferase involved in cell wall biosynthesis